MPLQFSKLLAAFTGKAECPSLNFHCCICFAILTAAGCITMRPLIGKWIQTFLFQIAALGKDLENRIKPYDC